MSLISDTNDDANIHSFCLSNTVVAGAQINAVLYTATRACILSNFFISGAMYNTVVSSDYNQVYLVIAYVEDGNVPYTMVYAANTAYVLYRPQSNVLYHNSGVLTRDDTAATAAYSGAKNINEKILNRTKVRMNANDTLQVCFFAENFAAGYAVQVNFDVQASA